MAANHRMATTKPLTLDQLYLACAGAKYSSDEGTHSYVLPDVVRERCLNPNSSTQTRIWVPTTDPYKWRQAIRQVNGIFRTEISPTLAGDFIWICLLGVLGGRVETNEGLRDAEAEMTALYRALEAIPGMDMGLDTLAADSVAGA